MGRKLAERGLVTYAPYKGVTLRAPGRRIADAILRRRRLWGVFLWDRLGLDPARADDVACDMEHITPDDVTERLAGFLDDAPVGPTGRPIPTASGAATHPDRPLADGTPGEQHRVAAIAGPPAAGAFLSEQGIAAGDLIDLMAVAEDGSALVATPRGVIRLGPRAAGWIHIEGRP
jgi:DtxR family Mn-dependent transcriptional regulator